MTGNVNRIFGKDMKPTTKLTPNTKFIGFGGEFHKELIISNLYNIGVFWFLHFPQIPVIIRHKILNQEVQFVRFSAVISTS